MEFILNFLTQYKYFFPVFLFVFLVVRYFLINGGMYLLLWKIFDQNLEHRKIQNSQIKPGQIRYEIKYSLIAYLSMTIVTTPLFFLFLEGHTAIYLNWSDYPLWMVPIGILIFFVWHDVYFYWSHRWLHSKWAFKHIHYIHHLSKVPTPFDSHCFHWIEGVLQIIFIYPIVLWVPMHPWTFVGYMALTQFFSAWGHFNYELMPFKTWSAWWGSWVTTSTHHNFHHKYNNGNLALYFKFWDKKFGTLDERVAGRFQEYLKKSRTSE